jgi:hypothetical protein
VIVRAPHGACFRRLVARARTPLRALAWNNLLGFPYLHGYGLESLERLAREFGLIRTVATGDTLGTQADRSAPCGRGWKSAQSSPRSAARGRVTWCTPWLDVHLRDVSSGPISQCPREDGRLRRPGV